MASHEVDIVAKCEEIRKSYSPCDVSDALLTLGVPYGGTLADIAPMSHDHKSKSRLVAPVSTVLFVAKTHKAGDEVGDMLIPKNSNLPSDRHFTDLAPSGSAVIIQQPPDQISAPLGDITATRYHVRGIKGIFVDGRSRDVVGVGAVCHRTGLQVWTKSLSSTGASAEAMPWAVDVPLRIGKAVVRAGDVICADEAERVACVIPREKLDEVLKLLPVQKEADNGVLEDVKNGMGYSEAAARHPDFYVLQKH